MTGAELMAAHVRAFNHGVATGDWEPMLARFDDRAELRFPNVAAGPFVGLDAPPDDAIQRLGVQEEDEGRRVVAAFAWVRGGTGRLVLEREDGAIARLTVIFDE